MNRAILILTPTLGGSPYLEETVQSVRQLNLPIRHVLVCPEHARADLAARFPECEVVTDQGKVAGLYGALNAGLAAAMEWDTWDWYTYINDDDLLSPAFAEMTRRHCRPENLASVAYGNIETIDGTGESLGWMTVEANPAYFPALLQTGISPTGQQGMLFGRPVVAALGGYDLRFRVCGDLEFWARARAQGFAFRHYSLAVGRFRIRPGQISGDVSLLRQQIDEVTRLHFPKQASRVKKQWARLRYRCCNLPRYFGRLRSVGLTKSFDVLEAGGRPNAESVPSSTSGPAK